MLKEALLVLENMFQDQIHFNVSDDSDTSRNIVNSIIEHYGVFHDGILWEFKNNTWSQKQPLLELSVSYSNIIVEGDILVKGESLSITPQKIIKRIEEELPDITTSTQAYYNLVIDVYDIDYKKLYSILNEIQISLSKEGYEVLVVNKKKQLMQRSLKGNRYSDLDLKSITPDHVGLPEDKRFANLDLDPKGSKVKRTKDKPDARFSTLDLNQRKIHKDFEALLFQQDTQQDQVQTAQQKLGKQLANVQVSKSVQSQVDKMSYQKAYDIVEDAKKIWDDTDAYDQYTDTVELASKWYQNNLVQVSGFDVIEKSYQAADLMRKISALEDEIANTKSRATATKLKKELSQDQDDLNVLMPQIKDALKDAKGQDEVDARTRELENRKEDYIEDYQSNLAEWKSLKDKMEKAGKLIETMEALRDKYASQYDLPPLLYRYRSLMDTPIPNLIDVESLETPDAGIIYRAWRDSMINYRKELESFNDSFRANYDVLARLLALKSKSRSLF